MAFPWGNGRTASSNGSVTSASCKSPASKPKPRATSPRSSSNRSSERIAVNLSKAHYEQNPFPYRPRSREHESAAGLRTRGDRKHAARGHDRPRHLARAGVRENLQQRKSDQ